MSFCRYSPSELSDFAVDKDSIRTVDDDGPGVSPEDREQIFRPFYRTDEARDRESGGTGLGLAIVETAIQQHRGWVKAEDSPLGGLRGDLVAAGKRVKLRICRQDKAFTPHPAFEQRCLMRR